MTAGGWDEAAAAYDQAISEFTGLYAEEAVRLAEVGPDHDVLDVAAGTGAAALLAARLGARVVATDFSPLMIDRLRARAADEGLENLRAEVMDGQALDLADETFDAAISIFGVIFFPDRVKGFSEMHRVLRPGGRAVVSSWSSRDRVPIVSQWGEAVRRAIPELPKPETEPAVFSLSDPERFRREMETAGFRDVRVVPVSKTWRVGTPDEYWERFRRASPVLGETLAAYADRIEDVRAAFVDLLRERYEGEVTFDSEALIGLGRK